MNSKSYPTIITQIQNQEVNVTVPDEFPIENQLNIAKNLSHRNKKQKEVFRCEKKPPNLLNKGEHFLKPLNATSTQQKVKNESFVQFDQDIENMLDILGSDAEFQKMSDNEQLAWLESLFYQDTNLKNGLGNCAKQKKTESVKCRQYSKEESNVNVSVNKKMINIAQSYFPPVQNSKNRAIHETESIASKTAKGSIDEKNKTQPVRTSTKPAQVSNLSEEEKEKEKRISQKINLIANVTNILKKF